MFRPRIKNIKLNPWETVVTETTHTKDGTTTKEVLRFYYTMNGGPDHAGLALAHSMRSAHANYTDPHNWVSRFIGEFLYWTYQNGGVHFGGRPDGYEEPMHVYTIDEYIDCCHRTAFDEPRVTSTITVDAHGERLFSGTAWEFGERFSSKERFSREILP